MPVRLGDTVAGVAPEHYPDALPISDYRDRASYRQLRSRYGIGVAVEQSLAGDAGGRAWICIASDGKQFRHLRAVAPDLPEHAGIPPVGVETALELKAAEYPEDARLTALVNASPISLDADELGGEV
jgi:hypothetical protein